MLNRRDFIRTAAGAGAAIAAGKTLAEGRTAPILRVGIVSDSQGYPDPHDWGFHNLERAFEVLAREGIDVLVNAGDIADTPDEIEGLAYVQEL